MTFLNGDWSRKKCLTNDIESKSYIQFPLFPSPHEQGCRCSRRHPWMLDTLLVLFDLKFKFICESFLDGSTLVTLALI